MGAWGYKTFENDTALDCVATLEERGFGEVTEKVNSLVNLDQLQINILEDSDLAQELLVVCEIITLLLQSSNNDTSRLLGDQVYEDLKNKVESSKKELLDAVFLTNLSKVTLALTCSSSELFQLWQETDDFEKWNEYVTQLISKINPLTTTKPA